ncbi:hypothetical protein ACSMXN_08335 [Jatrophihabitans sp. DSM 45814]
MARIVFEGVILLLIVAGVLFLAREWDDRRRMPTTRADRALTAPTTAVWQATNVGTHDNQTEVAVILRGPGPSDVWERRTCAVIPNLDPDYDTRLYNAMEDARARASLLNSMRDG